MPRKKPNDELPPEVLAVLRISPDLKSCQKFRNANIYQFAEHLNEGKCEQCMGKKGGRNFLFAVRHVEVPCISTSASQHDHFASTI